MENLHVLIADDSPTIRRYVRRIIEVNFSGAEVSEAADGWEALNRLENAPVGLIFLDLVMPGMQGDEFLERALELIHIRRTGVIILTSMNTRELRHRMAEEELVLFVQKPVLMDEVCEKVHQVLARRKMPREAPRPV